MDNTLGATMRKLLFIPLIVLSLAALPKPAEAAIIGQLDIAGSVIVFALPAGETLIDFQGPAAVEVTSDGIFAGIGGTDTLIDLSSAIFPTSGFAPLSNFQTLSALPNLNFILEDIVSCPELGAAFTCLSPTSAFGFQESNPPGPIPISTQVTLIMAGTLLDANDPSFSAQWFGTFTAQFPGQSIADLVAQFTTAGNINTSFSASKIVILQAPEPAMLALLGTALLAGGARVRARRRQAAK